MKVKLIWLLASLLLLVMGGGRTGSEEVGEQRSSDPPTVDYFTDVLTGGRNYIYASTEGGKTIYIYGSGFDATASNNRVKFGDAPCIVKDGGATNNVITCVTTKVSSNTYYYNLELTVTVGKRTVVYPAYTLNFAPYYTPTVTRLSPSSILAGQAIGFVGNHLVNYADNIS